MGNKTLLEEISHRCLFLDPAEIQALFAQMDRDYLSQTSAVEVAEHLKMSHALSPSQALHIIISDEGSRCFKIVVVAYDYFSAFSIICGLLSSFGLNIEGGNVQTLSLSPGRKKIVDLFYVRRIGNCSFDSTQQESFKVILKNLIALLEKGDFREARAHVNQRLISHINQVQETSIRSQSPLKGLLSPIQIEFDNRHTPRWTILKIQGQDTPAFLYAFSNALAMRNIYIHKIKIIHEGEQIRDRLYISTRQGKKITGEANKKALQIAAVLIKQFIHFLNIAPDPTMAMTHFDQFLDKILEMDDTRPLIEFLKKKETMGLLSRFFGTSRFLWEDFLRLRFENLFPILEQHKSKRLALGQRAMCRQLQKRLRTASTFAGKRRIVNDFKDEEIFRIDLRHLHETRGQVIPFSKALTDLAEVVVSESLLICRALLDEKHGIPRMENGKKSPFAIFGLGKLGGKELGYASDIELLFVYGESGMTDGIHSIPNSLYFDGLAQEINRFIDAKQEGIFQIDSRLRPHGKSGSWATSFSKFLSYYSETGKSAAFERQALIKLRAVAGSRSLGKKCEAARDHYVYSGAAWDLKEALDLRAQQIEELVPKGQVNVKYSRGGIVDIEYLTQYLQIMHGHEIPDLKTPSTLAGLTLLKKNKILPEETAAFLKKTYLFLRSLIDALRMVRGNARDLLLPKKESEEFIFLARRMGYAKKDWRQGSEQLAEAIAFNMSKAEKAYREFFG